MVDVAEVNVFDLKYMKMIRFSLNSIGSWPNKQFGDKSLSSHLISVYNIYLFISVFLGLVAQILYLKKNNNVLGFLDLGHTFITILMTCVFLERLSLPMKNMYCKVTEEFVSKFHLTHHRNKSYFAGEMNKRVNKICIIGCAICHYQMYMGLNMFNLVPLYNNYKNGMLSAERPLNVTFEHSTYHDLPFDHYTDPYYYTIMVFFNWYISYNVSCGFCCFDLLISLIVIHIWGHISILKHDLKYFPRPKREVNGIPSLSYTEEELEDVFQRLVAIIKHHNMIKEFMAKISKTYNITLCLYYAFHLLAGCVLLLECSSLDPEALGKYGLLTLILFQQLIQLSVIFELIGSTSDTLVGAVYSLPWECMEVKSRRSVLLFLQNVQKPLALKAGEMVPVGVQTMSAILRTSMSYFIMLKTFEKA